MKKSLFVLLIAFMAICMVLVSCKSDPKPVETGDDGFLHVSTFTDFVKGLTSAKKTESKTLVLDADIAWDATKYPGGADVTVDSETAVGYKSGSITLVKSLRPNESALSVDVTGITIDLGGHTISGVPTNAFNLKGDSFTLKNGSILGAGDNAKYSININYNGRNASTSNGMKELALDRAPAAYTESDPAWKKRITITDLTATGMLCGYSTVEIKNCTFTGGAYRGLVLQGSSGIVENLTVTTAESASSAGFVAHSYGTALLKGTCDIKGKFGLYSANCATLNIDSAAAVTAGGFGTFALYIETQGKVAVGGGATLTSKPAVGQESFNLAKGGMLTIAAGAILKDAEGAAMAKPIPAAAIKNDGANGSADASWAGSGVAPTITDNRT